MAIKTYTTTADGIETHFGSNHIGHFLLTKLLMPKILAAGKGARVINVGSFGYLAGGIQFDDHNFKVPDCSLVANRDILMIDGRMEKITTLGLHMANRRLPTSSSPMV